MINIDSYFKQSETGPGKTVMYDSSRSSYEEKRQWQRVHKAICTTFNAVCGNDGAFFRSRSDGAWLVTGGPFPSAPVSYDEKVDRHKLASYTALGKQFLPNLTPIRECTILTVVPTVKTDISTAEGVASALGFTLVSPRLAGLATFDGIHLDSESTQRWSAAFFQKAGPQIRQCLAEPSGMAYRDVRDPKSGTDSL